MKLLEPQPISKLLGINQGSLDLLQSTADQQVNTCSSQSGMITLSFEGDALRQGLL